MEDIDKSHVFDHSCLRMCNMCNDGIHPRSNSTYVNNTITDCCLRWLGHIFRHPPQELLVAGPCDGWRQKRGGPIKTWTDIV